MVSQDPGTVSRAPGINNPDSDQTGDLSLAKNSNERLPKSFREPYGETRDSRPTIPDLLTENSKLKTENYFPFIPLAKAVQGPVFMSRSIPLIQSYSGCAAKNLSAMKSVEH